MHAHSDTLLLARERPLPHMSCEAIKSAPGLPCPPSHSFSASAPWLMACTASYLIILPAIHFLVIAASRQLAGYRALPKSVREDWNQSAMMTIIIPSIMFVFYTKAHLSCGETVHLRTAGFVPWVRAGQCCPMGAIRYHILLLKFGESSACNEARLFVFFDTYVLFSARLICFPFNMSYLFSLLFVSLIRFLNQTTRYQRMDILRTLATITITIAITTTFIQSICSTSRHQFTTFSSGCCPSCPRTNPKKWPMREFSPFITPS